MKVRLWIIGIVLVLTLSSCQFTDATMSFDKNSDTTVRLISNSVTTKADTDSVVTTVPATEAVTIVPDTTAKEELPITIRSIDIDQNIRIGMNVFNYGWGYFDPGMNPVGTLAVEMPLPWDENYPIEEIIRREWFFGIVAYDYSDVMTKIEGSDNIVTLYNSLYWSPAAVYTLENYKVIESANGYSIYEFYHGMSQKFIDIYSHEINDNYLKLREYLYLITDGKTVIKISFSPEVPGFDIDRTTENKVLDYLIKNIKLLYGPS